MNLQDTPVVFKILNVKKLTLESVIEGDKFVCTDEKGQRYVLKENRGVEDVFYEKIFPLIERMNLNFGTLQLPESLDIVHESDASGQVIRKFIIIRHYDGKSFNSVWNEVSGEGYGGRSIEPQFANKIVGVLDDFSKIDTDKLKPFDLLTFNFDVWKNVNFSTHLGPTFISKGIITQSQFDKFLSFVSQQDIFKNSKMILTNGDFYPRNFIELDSGKVVIIDWEGRVDVQIDANTPQGSQKFPGQRNALLNYLGNHLAFIFVHMYGNKKFQKILIKNAFDKFNLDKRDFQVGVIIKALEQCWAFGGNALGQRQIEIALEALEDDFVDTFLD